MTTLHIIKLSENAPAMAHGFRYNVQIWTKDSGRGWCYAGNGKFLKTAGEVLSYGKEHADFYSADMYKDFYACMSEEDVVYFVGVYKWHASAYIQMEKLQRQLSKKANWSENGLKERKESDDHNKNWSCWATLTRQDFAVMVTVCRFL